MALVGSAAVEGYIVTSGKINSTTGRFYLNVASKTDAFCGYITIKYDPEKVTLLKQVKTQTGEDDEGNAVYLTTYEEYTSGNFAVAQSGCSFADQKADVSKGNIVVQWFNTSKVSAGANVFRLWFVAKDKSGDSFTESTFTLITNETERVDLGAEKGPIYVGTEAGDVMPTAEAMTWSYKNASVKDTPATTDKWEAGSDSEISENMPTIKYKTDLTGAGATGFDGKKLVIFGKNSTSNTSSLKSGEYYVTIGENSYFGKTDVTGRYWAIIILDSDNAKVAKDSYSYEAYKAKTADTVNETEDTLMFHGTVVAK